jgi:DNA invertase Pin-like site-specific DNA recombinase
MIARRMWIKKNGVWPEGKICTHVCDNKLCINPEHIIPGTMSDNQAGMAERDRSPWGDRCGARILSSKEAKEIYALKNSGLSQRVVGERYGVGGTAVRNIWNDINWWRDNQGMENFPVLLTKKLVGKKLTLREVESIRSMKGKLSSTETARMYKISQRMVIKIWNNISWRF